ncbi:MAG: hypothetical protein IJP09_02470 [Clostridia bacterium]|nr:hypothetical protein [Clostridia bacterium]
MESYIPIIGGVILSFGRNAKHAVVVVKEQSTGLYYVYDPGNPSTNYCGWELKDYMENNPTYRFSNIKNIYYFKVNS